MQHSWDAVGQDHSLGLHLSPATDIRNGSKHNDLKQHDFNIVRSDGQYGARGQSKDVSELLLF